MSPTSGDDPSSPNISDSGEINDIIHELEYAGVDDLETLINTDGFQLYGKMYERDLAALNLPPEEPIVNQLMSSETPHIIQNIHDATVLPASSIVWAENDTPQEGRPSYSEVWGKRSHESISEATTVKEEPQSYNYVDLSDATTMSNGRPDVSNAASATKKKRKMSIDEKAEKRKSQTRTASKLYRQRRKALEVQLSEKLDQLESEKKQLMSEQRAAQELLLKMKEENEKLRKDQKVQSEENAHKRKELLLKLEKQVGDQANDEQLCSTICEIKGVTTKCSEFSRCNLRSLISPSAVEKLVAAGFFENTVQQTTQKGTIEDVVAKLKNEIKSLTPDQKAKMDRVIENHNQAMLDIRKERDDLTKQIGGTFAELRAKTMNDRQTQDYVEVLGSLEHLRGSLYSEGITWDKSLKNLIDDILTPRQMAQFLLKIEVEHASVKQLNTFWTALNQTVHTTKA